jgi:hypothetical protein
MSDGEGVESAAERFVAAFGIGQDDDGYFHFRFRFFMFID